MTYTVGRQRRNFLYYADHVLRRSFIVAYASPPCIAVPPKPQFISPFEGTGVHGFYMER